MSLFKQVPEDFQVKEHHNLCFVPEGKYAYLLLKKRNCNTLDALRELGKRWKIPLNQIGFGGLKDKFALTQQIISIPRGYLRSKDYKLSSQVKLKFLGYGNYPIQLGGFIKNEFKIRLRGLDNEQIYRLKKAALFLAQFGFPNYFGEQRFGSVLGTKDFIVRLLLKNDYEMALKTYLISFLKRPRQRTILKNWGNWEAIKNVLPQNDKVKRAVVKALKKGKSYEGVFKVIPKNIRVMFAFCYQSYLWNELLSCFIKDKFSHFFIPIALWKFAVYKGPLRDLSSLEGVELPYVGTSHVPNRFEVYYKKVLKKEGLSQDELWAQKIGIKLFLEGQRKIIVIPESLQVIRESSRNVLLHFFLPPNSYATVMIKCLFSHR